MGRYKRNPASGGLSHLYAVEALSSRLRRALGDWAKNGAHNGDPIRVLRDALVLTLGPKTIHHLFIQQQQKETDERHQGRTAGRE